MAVIDIEYRGKEPFAEAFHYAAAVRDVLDRTRQFPGVESADLANPSMLSGGSMTSDVEAHGNSTGNSRKAENTYFAFASTQHFGTLRIPLLRGRDFTDRDRKGSGAVAIINQRLASCCGPAKILLASRSPVG